MIKMQPTGWMNQIGILSQEPGIPTTARTVVLVPSRPGANSHLTRAACQLTRMAIAGPSVGDAESCSWAPGVQWQEHVSASTHFLGTRCSLISFNTFPFCLCLPELVSNLQGGTNPILQLKIINQIALLFCAGEF